MNDMKRLLTHLNQHIGMLLHELFALFWRLVVPLHYIK